MSTCSTGTITIRPATIQDSEQIRQIYSQYITKPVTFENRIPSEEEFRQRVSGILAFYPYLVAESQGTIVGYAYAHAQAQRAAFRWNAELSIYLAPESAGHGLGKALYTAMLHLLKLQGIKTAYALITVPNKASQGLHERMGFKLEWIQPRAGFKDGSWHDVAWYLLPLAEACEAPEDTIPASEIDPSQFAQILADANQMLKS